MSDFKSNEDEPIDKLKVKCKESGDEFTLKGRPCELSSFSFVPPTRKYETAIRNIYNFKSDEKVYASGYDQLFNITYGYDNKVHRCDRRHAKLKGLDVWSEEIQKVSPSLSSSEYGRHIITTHNETVPINSKENKVKYLDSYDPNDRKHVRIMKVKSEFYNRNGINDLSQSNKILFQ